jgi:hypothetical protein
MDSLPVSIDGELAFLSSRFQFNYIPYPIPHRKLEYLGKAVHTIGYIMAIEVDKKL